MSTDSTSASPHTFLHGATQAIPIMLVYVAYATPFGFAAVQMGVPWWAVTAMSFFGYAGAAQFLALHLIGVDAGISAIVTATCILNLRHIFYGMALSLRIPRLPQWQLLYLAHSTTDESFGVNIAKDAPQLSAGTLWGTNLCAHLTWTGATTAGAVLASLSFKGTVPLAQLLQLDCLPVNSCTVGDRPLRALATALLPMLFAVLLALRLLTWRDVAVAVSASAITFGAMQVMPGHGAFLVGAVAATTMMQSFPACRQERLPKAPTCTT